MKDEDVVKSIIIRTPLRDGCSPLVCLSQKELLALYERWGY